MVSIANAWEEVEDDLTGPEPDYEAEPTPLPDLESVNRELRRVAKIRRERDTFKDLVDSEVARLQAKLAEKVEQSERDERWHLDRLRRYHEAALALDGRAKTIGLPNGKLKARAGQPVYEISDDKFVPWARASGGAELLRVSFAPDRVAVKNRLVVVGDHVETPGGEPVPGIVVKPAETSFVVDTSEVE